MEFWKRYGGVVNPNVGEAPMWTEAAGYEPYLLLLQTPEAIKLTWVSRPRPLQDIGGS